MRDMWLLLVLLPGTVLGFREQGNSHWACGCSSHYFFPLFPRLLLWQVEVKLLTRVGVYPYLKRVMYAIWK